MKAKFMPLIGAMLGLCLALLLTTTAHSAGGSRVLVLDAKGPVTPVMQSYIERGIMRAQAEGVACLIITLNTPGGSLSVTREIVASMRESTVPIVVYVSPTGATAASAGTILTMAGHIAAMAPGTSIGAASPVSSQGEELGETEKQKAENIVVADLKALTENRSPQAQEWVEKAVREAAALTSAEALAIGVIDIEAPSLQALVEALEGRQVMVSGNEVILHTADANIEHLPMTFAEGFLHTILDPNIAFILMTVGINALLFELSSPGGYAAGVIGAICLLLGLFALGVLSVNWAGLALIVLAFILFIADIKAPTHGVLTALGITCFVLGALVLFNSPVYRVSPWLIATVALFSASFFAFVIAKALAAQKRPATTGRESLIGDIAEVRQTLDPRGMVYLQGEIWQAISRSGIIPEGATVRIVAVKGLLVEVEAV